MATIQPQRRSLAEIKSKLLNPATTSHFQVNIGTPSRSDGSFNRFLRETGLNYDQDQLNILCSDASLPGSRLATTELLNDFHGVRERHVYRRLYDDSIQLSFYVDANQYHPIKFFEGWMNYITGETSENILSNVKNPNFSYRMKFPINYRGSLEITKFEKNIDSRSHGDPLTYQFVNVFPLSVSSMPVSYNQSSLLKCTVSMAYTRYFIDRGKSGTISDVLNPIAQAAANVQSLFNLFT